jgi:hypothetical protein
MTDPKTRPTKASVDKFIRSIKNEQTQNDCYKIIEVMKKAAKAEPIMWGTNIVGFGTYSMKYASGKELDWPIIGFSPRKQNITLYLSSGFDEYDSLLKKLGKHTSSKVCLYIKRLDDVDMKVLKELVSKSVNHMKKQSK